MPNATHIAVLFITLIPTLVACQRTGKQRSTTTNSHQQATKLIRIESPTSGHTVSQAENIELRLQTIDGATPDSVVLHLNDQRIATLNNLSASIATDTMHVGILAIRATAWLNGQRQSASTNIHIKSNIKPKQLKYKVINTLPHDPLAYTQGLFIHQGQLYESTGQNGASSLRRIELTSGQVMQSVNLETTHFGEGATFHNGLIYQLTWTSGVCLVYNAETFDRTATYTYNTQGWGITSNGSELIMSDGSNVLRFMQPNGFAELRRLEVYDNQGPVRMLNELEYIDGLIYANIYTTDRIAIIDPKTGVVVAQADLSGILPNSQRTGREDVLNGIAYNTQTKQLFVTGKYWSKMFEIKLE